MNPFILGCAAALILGVTSSRVCVLPSEFKTPSPVLPPVMVGLLAAFVVRLAVLAAMMRVGFAGTESDEVARWGIASAWARDPFFFSHWDGVWLSGNFAWHGMFIRLVGDPVAGMFVGSLAAQAILLVAVAHAALRLGAGPWNAALAPLIASVAFPFLWLAAGPMPEPLMAGLMVLAFTLLRDFALCDRGRLRRRLALATLAGLALFGAASQHYLGWFAIVVGAPIMAAGMWRRRREVDRATLLGVAIIVLGAALFPALWAYCSWRVLGSPFAFLANQRRMMDIHMTSLADEETRRMLPAGVYPLLYWAQAAPLIPLALAAGWRGRRSGPGAGSGALAIFIFALLAASALRATLSGYYPPFHRYVIIPFALTIPLAAAGLPDVAGLFRGARRASLPAMGLLAAVALFGLGWGGFNLQKAFDFQAGNPCATWSNDVLALGQWLGGELRNPQTLTAEEVEAPIGFRAGAGGGGAALLPMVAYLGDADQLRYMTDKEWPGSTPTDISVVICDAESPPVGFAQVSSIGRWGVWRRPVRRWTEARP